MPQFPAHIFGMHDSGAESLFTNANRSGWITISVQVNPPDSAGNFSVLANAGFGVIVRLNNGYGSAGTLPFAAQYDTFAQQCASFVAGSQGAKIWIVGNETNMAGERPGNVNGNGGEPIPPSQYAQCFAKVRAAIKALPGRSGDWVVPAATAPWNAQTTYPGNSSGEWGKYFQDLLTQCVALKASPDALALHAYTHGLNPALVASDEKTGAFPNRFAHFRVYRDWLSVVPASLKTCPVFITETQPADPDWWKNQNVGWVQAVYKEINAWNSAQANQPIQCVCLFRWQTGESNWSISDKLQIQNDLRAALNNDYRARWPTVTPPPDPAASAAIVAAKKLTWMPINTDGALYKFAQAKNLGYPQTDEFEFVVDADAYVGQVYNLGIVYVKKGDWGNVKWVKKP